MAFLAAAAPYLAAAGAAVGAVSAVQQGQAASKAAQFNAQVSRNNQLIAEQNADYAVKAGIRKAEAESMKGRAIIGKLKSAQAASGVDVGSESFQDVIEGATEANVLDTATVLHNAQLEAYGYRSQAKSFEANAQLKNMESDSAETGGYTSGLGTLLSGASSAGTKWTGLQTKTPSTPTVS